MNIEKAFYQIKNWHAHWRAWFIGSYIVVDGVVAKVLGAMAGVGDMAQGRVRLEGKVFATVIRKNPKWWQRKVLSLGCLGERVVTTAGVNYLRDDFAAGAGSADISNFKYHGCGTGTTAEAIGDTALVTECTTAINPDSTRGVGTQVNSVAKTYSTVATMTFDASAAVTEHGLFSAASSGTLWDRTVFSAVNVASGDSIQFTYTLTISDGG